MNVFQQTFRLCQTILQDLQRNDDWEACELKRIMEQVEGISLQVQALDLQLQMLSAELQALTALVGELLADGIPNVDHFVVTIDPPVKQ